MGALFAGVVRAPMTSVVMIFETTRDYAVIVPLMIANLVSFFLSSRLQKEPIYEALAMQDGIHLPGGAAQRRQGQRQVAQVMRPATNWIAAEMPIAKVVDGTRGKEFHTFLVGDGRRLIGVVSLEQIEQAVTQGEEDKSVGDLIDGTGASIFRTCMRTMRSTWRSNAWARAGWICCRWSAARICISRSGLWPSRMCWRRTEFRGGEKRSGSRPEEEKPPAEAGRYEGPPRLLSAALEAQPKTHLSQRPRQMGHPEKRAGTACRAPTRNAIPNGRATWLIRLGASRWRARESGTGWRRGR